MDYTDVVLKALDKIYKGEKESIIIKKGTENLCLCGEKVGKEVLVYCDWEYKNNKPKRKFTLALIHTEDGNVVFDKRVFSSTCDLPEGYVYYTHYISNFRAFIDEKLKEFQENSY